MALEYILSSKGNQLLVCEKFVYRKERVYKDKIIWKCIKYGATACPGRLHVKNDVVVKEIGHSHLPDAAMISARVAVNEVKRRARETVEGAQNIVVSACTNLGSPAIGKLPNIDNLKRIIRRERVRNANAPAASLSLLELIIPDAYKQFNGENFLLYDSGAGEDRILVFLTTENLRFMAANPLWLCDGTFKASPALFNQLYTIHAVEDQFCIPTIFALLPNRTQITYQKLFAAVKNLQPDVNPQTIMTDFERAAINAITAVFPDARQTGCFFHFKQCIHRHIQENAQLNKRYRNEENVAMQLNLLGALAFIPPDDVVTAYEELLDTEFYTDNFDELSDILDYMERTWIGRLMRGGRRRQPLFVVELWNQHQNVFDGINKTTNAVEGWHNSFNRLLGAAHPTIWKLIDGLKDQQTATRIRVQQFIRGDAVQRKKKHKTEAARIKRLVEQYDNETKMNFLRGICHSI